MGGGKIFINFSLYNIEGLAFFNGIIALLYNVLIFCFVMCLNNDDSENHKLKAKICRNCSTIIYFSHYTIICGVKLLLQVLGMNSLVNNNVFVFILVMLLCMFVCLIVLRSTTMKKLYFIS